MRINEVLDDTLGKIKDLLMYLKIKNVSSVDTSNVMKELEKYGISSSYEELEPLINSLEFIEDISKDKITFKSNDDANIRSPDAKDMDKEAVASMARRARKRRENA